MSDIQRYDISGTGIMGDTLPSIDTNSNGEYVTYDDHIYIVSEAEERHISVVDKLEARIAELEKSHFNAVQYQNDLLKIIETQGQLLNGRTEASIKAEGIRERFHAIKALMDGKGNDPFREGYLYALELFIEYADELESDNEVLEKGND